MLAIVSGDLDARDHFLRLHKLVPLPTVQFVPFFIGEFIIIAPDIPLDDDSRFFKRLVIFIDAEMLVSLGRVVIGEDCEVVGRLDFRSICLFAQVFAN